MMGEVLKKEKVEFREAPRQYIADQMIAKMQEEKMDNTQAKIDLVCQNGAKVLKIKNQRYGDAVINPLHIFSKSNANSQVCSRLDDKLSRIKHAQELRKNDVFDVWGYLTLLMIERNWLEFDDLID
jgi:hypothetical protein